MKKNSLDSFQCPGCSKSFASIQALGNHKNFCSMFKEYNLPTLGKIRKVEAASAKVLQGFLKGDQPVLDPTKATGKPDNRDSRLATRGASVAIDGIVPISGNSRSEPEPEPKKADGRHKNRGSCLRTRYTYLQKYKLIEQWETYQEQKKAQGKTVSPTMFVDDCHGGIHKIRLL